MEIIKFNDFMSGNYGKNRYEKVEVPLVAESAAEDFEVISLLGEYSLMAIRVMIILFAVKFSMGVALSILKTMPLMLPIGG